MTLDLPGFADPVGESQACFRAVLQALSRPGSVHDAGRGLTPPAGLAAATAAVLLTLVDAETPLHIAARFADARDWIAFHCGAFAGETGSRGGFILCDTLPELACVNAGTDEGPEDSATIILQIAGFDGGAPFLLSGPGLERPARITIPGLPAVFADIWAANHALYPRGVDLILCAGSRVAAFPRSLRIVPSPIGEA